MLNLISFAAVNLLITACYSVTTSVDADLFEKTLNETPTPQLVDVRTFEEFREGHLVGAMLMDIRRTTFISQIQRLDKTRPVFVYCRSGRRSLDAAKILEQYKFTKVYNLEGGINEWRTKGKPIKI